MKSYKKPRISSNMEGTNIVPAAAALSVGGAFAVGVAMGLMKDDKMSMSKLNSLNKVVTV